MMHSSEVTVYRAPWRSPQHTHPYSQGKDNPVMCHPKTTAVCNQGDKEQRGKLSPAGEHSLWSTEKDKSKLKAGLTEPVCLAGVLDEPQRDTGD